MSRQFWTESLAWATADGTAITNTATETILFPNVTIPGNFMQDGRVLRLTASGRYSNVVTAVPTISFFIRWGGVASTVLLAQSPAITTSPTAITSAPWNLDCLLQVRTNGATGSIFAMGSVALYTGVAPKLNTTTGETSAADLGLVASMHSAGTTVPAAVTADLTADTALTLSAKWSVANASNSIQGHIYVIEALN